MYLSDVKKSGTMAERQLGRTVGNLFLALLNATPILANGCLWLTWGPLSSAECVSQNQSVAAKSCYRSAQRSSL